MGLMMKQNKKTTVKRSVKNVAVSVTRLCDKFINAPVTDGTLPTVTSVVEKTHNPRHGRYSGWGVQKFQQWVMGCSASGDMLTDAEMSEIFTIEFPRTKCVVDHGSFPVRYLRDMRTQYNAGTHAGMNGKRPERPVCPIEIVGGQRVIIAAWLKTHDAKTGDKKQPATTK
jgi:hypothetical protein